MDHCVGRRDKEEDEEEEEKESEGGRVEEAVKTVESHEWASGDVLLVLGSVLDGGVGAGRRGWWGGEGVDGRDAATGRAVGVLRLCDAPMA